MKDQIQAYRCQMRQLQAWRRKSGNPLFRAQCTLELAQIRLSIAAMRFALAASK